jgi:peptidoglycan-associated lipoprotein
MDHFVKSRGVAAWAAALCSPIMLLACAHDQSAGPRRVAEPLVVPQVVPPPIAVIPPAPPAAAVFVVSESVRKKCNLPEALAAEAPEFDFDRAELRDRGKDMLDRIALCMTDGSLQDRGITVTGHTDARGTDVYNMDLGLERAISARNYLGEHGVTMSAVQVQSRGEQDATGTGPDGWQVDRRVEIDETR